MGIGYILVNKTKKEQITFSRLPVNTKKEISGNPASAAIVAWYLLENQGDEIQFISDTYDDWPFSSGKRGDEINYHDLTEKIIDDLIKIQILKDNGFIYQDEDDPENIYIRKIDNIWLKD